MLAMQFRSAGIACVLSFTALCIRGTAGEVTLDLIRAMLKEHQTACHSLRIKYTHSQESRTIGSGAKTVHIHSHEGVLWEWLQDGHKQCFRTGPQDLPDPTPDHPGQWASYDGRFGYQVYYWDHTPFAREVHKVRHMPEQLQHCRLLAALGWQLGVDQESLYRCLELPGSRLEGREDVDGVLCWKVRCDELTFRGVKGSGLIAWFDEAHGFLPRRWWISPLRALRLPKGSKFVYQPQPGERMNSGETAEFISITDAATGDSRWFPKRVRQEGLISGEIEVVDVTWNVPISSSEFVPKPVEGSLWVDTEGGMSGEKYVGGERGLKLFYERLTEANLAAGLAPPTVPGQSPPRPTISPGQSLADANPMAASNSHWIRIVLAATGLILLFAAYRRWRTVS
jgi:hypothetical protein